jgi:hypothetical protein
MVKFVDIEQQIIMWRMRSLIRHICGERKDTVGQPYSKETICDVIHIKNYQEEDRRRSKIENKDWFGHKPFGHVNLQNMLNV